MKLTTITLALSLALSGHAFAADKKEDKEPKTLSEMIKGQTEFAGIFSLYQDEKTGKHLMVISESQLNTPFVFLPILLMVLQMQVIIVVRTVKLS